MMLKKPLLAGVAFLCLTQLADAQNFNQLIAFGDSTTDTGWFAHASTSNPILDALIANSIAAGGNAHFTGPGPGNAQILGAFFGLPANPANTPGGTNYAIGGAFDDATLDGILGPGHQNIIPTESGTSAPNLPGTAEQIGNYLASVGGHANPNALYVVSSGGNDVFITPFFPSMALATAFLLNEANALANGVGQLQAAGARYIVVSNEYEPPAVTPNEITLGKLLFNATWSDLTAARVKFIPADTQSVILAVEQNPVLFGITAPITSYACVPPALLTGMTGYGETCAPTTTPNPNYGYLVSSNATQTHLFMDGIHLTEAGQLIIADYYYNLLVAPSEISFLAETAIQTTFETIRGIQEQIDLTQRLRPAGWNVWINGELGYLKLDNSYAGFPNDPGVPLSGTLGVDYKWQNGWLAGAALTAGAVNPSFSLGGGFTQDTGGLSLYTAYRNVDWWGDLVGTAAWLGYDTNRPVPIGISVQPNTGSTSGYDLSLAGEIGYDFHTGFWTHGPVAGFILQQARVDGFTESGGFTSLSFGAQVRDSEVSALGYQARFDLGMWHPFAQILWDHEFDPLNRLVTASLTTAIAPSYSLPAVVLGRDWASATVGTQITFNAAWSGLASFTAQLGQDRATVLGGLVGLNYALAQPTSPALVYKN